MEMVRKTDIDGINLGGGEQFFVRAIVMRNVVFSGVFFCFFKIAAGHCGEFPTIGTFDAGHYFLVDASGGHESPTYFFIHKSS